jgi:hypothetical protein
MSPRIINHLKTPYQSNLIRFSHDWCKSKTVKRGPSALVMLPSHAISIFGLTEAPRFMRPCYDVITRVSPPLVPRVLLIVPFIYMRATVGR